MKPLFRSRRSRSQTDHFTEQAPGGGVRQHLGLVLAPIVFAWCQWGPAPAGTTEAMRAAAALTAVMALLWMCESIPLAATALLPLVFLPLFGIARPAEAAASYAGDLIFLFIGGFILANGVERWGLHRRVALSILTVVGADKRRAVGGLMAATAFISLWISNTAAALMMMPVGLSVLNAHAADDETDANFGTCMVLGISTAATIGGMGTPIGSTPNLLFVNTVERLYNIDVSFLQWMTMGLPLVLVFTVFAWWLFTCALFPPRSTAASNHQGVIRDHRRELGPLQAGEVYAGAVFAFTALGWIFREPRHIGSLHFGLTLIWPHISDGTIAIAGALALFGMPISLRPLRFALDWERGGKIPWEVILLFGGGLCLADGIARTHLDALLVGKLSQLHAVPAWLLLIVVGVACVLFSEVASNTATAALLLPLTGALAAALGQNPLYLMLPVALATSLGFMLPVATPPNALAIASGKVGVSQMALAGFILNVVGLVLIVGVLYLIGFRAFGIAPTGS